MGSNYLQRSDSLQQKVLEVSGGFVKTLMDLSLFLLVLTVESAGSGRTSVGLNRAFDKALSEVYGVSDRQARDAKYNLKSKGLVHYSRGGSDIAITEAGLKRLSSVLPTYEKERPWDGKLYLITYDIPEENKIIRDTFRSHLKKIGCGMLQASVWITPYDPREVLRKFVEENNLLGLVLISDIDENSSIGGEDIKDVLGAVYNIEELNERYREFLEDYSRGRHPAYLVASKYLSILKDDPQLPFELLPDGWRGDKAYNLLISILGSRPRWENTNGPGE